MPIYGKGAGFSKYIKTAGAYIIMLSSCAHMYIHNHACVASMCTPLNACTIYCTTSLPIAGLTAPYSYYPILPCIPLVGSNQYHVAVQYKWSFVFQHHTWKTSSFLLCITTLPSQHGEWYYLPNAENSIGIGKDASNINGSDIEIGGNDSLYTMQR